MTFSLSVDSLLSPSFAYFLATFTLLPRSLALTHLSTCILRYTFALFCAQTLFPNCLPSPPFTFFRVLSPASSCSRCFTCFAYLRTLAALKLCFVLTCFLSLPHASPAFLTFALWLLCLPSNCDCLPCFPSLVASLAFVVWLLEGL